MNVTTTESGVVHSECYTPEEWASEGPVLRAGWDAYNQAVMDKSKTPKERCEAKGGNFRFHKCQGAKGSK